MSFSILVLSQEVINGRIKQPLWILAFDCLSACGDGNYPLALQLHDFFSDLNFHAPSLPSAVGKRHPQCVKVILTKNNILSSRDGRYSKKIYFNTFQPFGDIPNLNIYVFAPAQGFSENRRKLTSTKLALVPSIFIILSVKT